MRATWSQILYKVYSCRVTLILFNTLLATPKSHVSLRGIFIIQSV